MKNHDSLIFHYRIINWSFYSYNNSLFDGEEAKKMNNKINYSVLVTIIICTLILSNTLININKDNLKVKIEYEKLCLNYNELQKQEQVLKKEIFDLNLQVVSLQLKNNQQNTTIYKQNNMIYEQDELTKNLEDQLLKVEAQLNQVQQEKAELSKLYRFYKDKVENPEPQLIH